MNIDSFLKIGHSHTMCQDYILTGTDPFPYIILADGCSQSKDSDIGARILCHTTLKYLKKNKELMSSNNPYFVNPNDMGERIILDAGLVLKLDFNVNIDSLDATLIFAYKHEGIYRVFMFGDGMIFGVKPNGYEFFHHISYTPNMPSYLRYRLEGMEGYIKSNTKVIIENEVLAPAVSTHTPMDPISLIFHESDVKFLMVASDGLDSIIYKEETMYKSLYLDLLATIKVRNKNGRDLNDLPLPYNSTTKEINFKDVCREITQFKLTKGSFLSRRVKKVLKEYLQKGFINDDDISIGCFYED